MFYTDGQTHEQTDMTKLVVTLRNFANVPKNASMIIRGKIGKERNPDTCL